MTLIELFLPRRQDQQDKIQFKQPQVERYK